MGRKRITKNGIINDLEPFQLKSTVLSSRQKAIIDKEDVKKMSTDTSYMHCCKHHIKGVVMFRDPAKMAEYKAKHGIK